MLDSKRRRGEGFRSSLFMQQPEGAPSYALIVFARRVGDHSGKL